MSTVELRLPWMPSANHYYVNINYQGRLMRVIGSAGKAYRRAVAEILIDAGSPRLDGDLCVDSLVLHPPDKAHRDTDNTFKCLWDSLQDRKEKLKGGGFVMCRGLFRDDWQIRKYQNIEWGCVVKDGRVDLTISEIPMELFEKGD